MKARVISTGKIVEVKRDLGYLDHEYKTEEGERFASEELDFNGEPDYWTRLEHKYAGMAMQGMIRTVGHDRMYPPEKIAIYAEACAHALIQKLKEKEADNG